MENHAFPETRWTRVLRLHEAGLDDATADRALSELCDAYWGPVRAFATRCGLAPHDAEDLTQSFFAELLTRGFLRKADPGRGRFRSFLLGAFRNHLAEHLRHSRRLKRAGDASAHSLEELLESGTDPLPASDPAPDLHFDLDWACVVLGRALEAVSREYHARGHGPTFDRLRPRLVERATQDDAEPAVGADRVALLRLRRRFRSALESEVAQTVPDPGDVDGELRHLLCAWASA